MENSKAITVNFLNGHVIDILREEAKRNNKCSDKTRKVRKRKSEKIQKKYSRK